MLNMHRLLPVIRTMMISVLCWSMSSAFALEVGVVDIDTITQSSNKLRALTAQLQSKAETYQEKFEVLKKEFENLKNEFEKNEMLMDDTTRQSKQSQLQKKAHEVEAARGALTKIIMNGQKDVGGKFQNIIVKFAESKKIDILLSGNGVIYANPKLDQTQAILSAIKKSNLS